MFNGSGDFSALNMQGDMSKRNTAKSGSPNTERISCVDNDSLIGVVYTILALFIMGILVDVVKEFMLDFDRKL